MDFTFSPLKPGIPGRPVEPLSPFSPSEPCLPGWPLEPAKPEGPWRPCSPLKCLIYDSSNEKYYRCITLSPFSAMQ